MRKDLRALVSRAAADRGVDVVLLAECGIDDVDVVNALGTAIGKEYVALSDKSDKVRIYTRAGFITVRE